MKNVAIIIIISFVSTIVLSQNTLLTITDSSDNNPLSNILLLDTYNNILGISDDKGICFINPEIISSDQIILFSYIYEKKIVNISDLSNQTNIKLKKNNSIKDENIISEINKYFPYLILKKCLDTKSAMLQFKENYICNLSNLFMNLKENKVMNEENEVYKIQVDYNRKYNIKSPKRKFFDIFLTDNFWGDELRNKYFYPFYKNKNYDYTIENYYYNEYIDKKIIQINVKSKSHKKNLNSIIFVSYPDYKLLNYEIIIKEEDKSYIGPTNYLIYYSIENSLPIAIKSKFVSISNGTEQLSNYFITLENNEKNLSFKAKR